jgi:hypothetical protein
MRRMSKGETPLRAVRIDGPLWDEAKAKAKKNGDNLSAIIRDALRQYIEESKDNADQYRSSDSRDEGSLRGQHQQPLRG